MEIYLIRHTRPDILKGICYGQSDIDVTESFYNEAAVIQQCLPQHIKQVYCSPLQRCRRLAEHLFSGQLISFDPDLMEINCGHWEMRHWDEIPGEELNPWMQNFVQVPIPGGESYIDLYQRTTQRFNVILQQNKPAAIVTHGGVIRSILAHITQTALADSFKAFSLHYGCVVKIETIDNQLSHLLLSNIATENEQHKPVNFYNKK